MLCEKCGIREANIKYTEVFNGVKTEHNLCAQCAKEMDLGPYSALIEGEFPLGKLLSSLLGLTDASASQAPKEDVVCPTCGTTYEEFIKNSRFGCLERKLRNCRKIRAIPANIRRSSRAVRRLQR